MAITKLQSSRDFFRIWFFWKNQAIFLFILIVGLVLFYAYTVTPIYESTAEILVMPKTNEGEVISTGVDDQRITPVTREDIYTEMEILGSNNVLMKTVENFGSDGIDLMQTEKKLFDKIFTPVKAVFRGLLEVLGLTSPARSEMGGQIAVLNNSLNVEPIVDSNLILVSLKAQRPEKTTEVLSKLLDTYLKTRNTIYTKEEGKDFYDDQAKYYKIKLDEAEKALNEFQKHWNIVNLQIQNQANIDLLTQLMNELKLLEIEYEEASSKVSTLKRDIQKDPTLLHLTKEMRTIPAIVELEKGIVPIIIKRSEISKTFTASSREFTSINSQIEMLRDEIRYEIEKAIKTDELELESKKIKIDALQQKIDFLKAEANEFSLKDKEHRELDNQVKLYRDSYLLYTKKTENAKIDSKKKERQLANVTISSMPTVPEKPVFPNRLIMLILSMFFGFLAAVAAPFIIESIDTKLKTIDDVESLLDLPVISSFADIKKG